ncbi:MAG: ketosteroid isomerase family protein [Cyanobacteria bacterium J06632_22]
MTAVRYADPQFARISPLKEGAKVVLSYFEFFNLSQYQQVAALFAEDGRLFPPFESPIVGQQHIAQYLTKEADGMTITVSNSETELLEDGRLQVDVRGKVTALVFQVNVAWRFLLTPDQAIESVKVDLLATLEELFKIRPTDE